jgi:hypothetical protein
MFIRRKLLPAIGLMGLVAGGVAQAAGLVTAGNAFLISGSTALDNQVKAALLLAPANGGPCTAGTISVYVDAAVTAPITGLSKAHQTSIVCTLAAAIGTAPNQVAAGTVVAFTKESNGGSNEGTANVATATALSFFDATQAPVGCAAGAAIAAGFYYTHQQAFTEFDACTGPLIQAVPQIGLADEDPALFNVGPQAITTATIAKLNTTPLFQNQFGIAVSLNLYRALQRAQGLALTDTLATMPTLSKSALAGLFSGVNGSWADILSPTGAAINSAAYTNGVTVPATVYTCRRGDNSGTNVSADVYFLQNRCIGALNPMTAVTTSVANCGGLPAGGGAYTPENYGCKWAAVNLADVTFGGTGGGDVASCLHAHSVAGQFAYGPLGATSKFDDPNGLEVAGDPGTNHWRYIAINGAKPTVEGMANGTYDYAFDNVLNTNKTLAGTPLSVATFLGNLFQSTTALEDIIVVQTNAGDANYATGGLLDALNNAGVLQNAPIVTLAELQGTGGSPVSAFTFAPGGGVNNCQRPLPVGPVLTKEQF